MEAARQLKYALRKLRRSPVFAVVSVLTLALAIGANAAVFSVINGVLLEPLPFDEPDELVGIWHTAPGLGFDWLNHAPALHYTYLADGTTFDSVGVWNDSTASITGLEEPEEVNTMEVTHTTLALLRIQPSIGRTFSAEDDTPDSPETVILSHGYWQSRFGGERSVLGDTLLVDGRAREIIGVMPPDLDFLDRDPRLYLPLRFDQSELFVGNFSYQGVGRLKPGVTLEQANADVSRMVPIAIERYPGAITMTMMEQARFDARLRPLMQDVVGDIGSVLWVLLGTVGMVLLIACANIANLFLVRAEEREVEVAVRTAMGASRGVLAREFLLESVLLAIGGGVAGLGLAYGGLTFLRYLAPQGLPRIDQVGINPTVLLFTAVVSLTAGVLFGAVPVLRYGRDLVGALKEGGRGGGAGKARHRARNTLAVVQMALALVLLVGAGLMIRSFMALSEVHPGFERPEEVMTARIYIPSAEIADSEQVLLAHQQIIDSLRAIPGVTAVSGSSSITMDRSFSNDPIDVEGFPIPEGQIPPVRRFKFIAPGYFETMGNPLVAGRSYTWADMHGKLAAVVITENLAREYWDSPAEAIGKRVRQPRFEALGEQPPWREIIGVVGDIHDDGPDQEAVKTVYWPMVVEDFWGEELRAQRSMKFAIRSERIGDPGFMDQVRTAIWDVNPNLPLAGVRTLQEIYDRSMARTSFTLVMLAIASGTALILGAVGVYGVTSYVVSQRRREIGVRMALGARSSDVTGLVLKQGFKLAAVGVVVGLGAAFGVTRLMSALLFGVSAADPLTYAGVGAAIAAVTLLASYLPAQRAARVDPAETLRAK